MRGAITGVTINGTNDELNTTRCSYHIHLALRISSSAEILLQSAALVERDSVLAITITSGLREIKHCSKSEEFPRVPRYSFTQSRHYSQLKVTIANIPPTNSRRHIYSACTKEI